MARASALMARTIFRLKAEATDRLKADATDGLDAEATETMNEKSVNIVVSSLLEAVVHRRAEPQSVELHEVDGGRIALVVAGAEPEAHVAAHPVAEVRAVDPRRVEAGDRQLRQRQHLLVCVVVAVGRDDGVEAAAEGAADRRADAVVHEERVVDLVGVGQVTVIADA